MSARKRIASGLDNLPQSLLCDILSFLPIKFAATTSVLSKSWRYAWAFSPNLSFRYDEGVDGAPVGGWIRYALKYKVLDLEIQIYILNNWSGPPRDVFVSKELVRLEIGTGDCCIIDLEGDCNLPSLKILRLDDVQFKDGCTGLLKLLSSCPVLEELAMVDMRWHDWDVCYDNASKYPTTNFDKLVWAKLKLGRKAKQEEEENVAGDVTDFWKVISNVEILVLKSETLEVLTEDHMPVFKNLSQLTIEKKTGPKLKWESLQSLLNNSPNLETLFLKVTNHASWRFGQPLQKVSKKFECGEDKESFMEDVKQFLEEVEMTFEEE
ncbi:PREDICTED: F-box/LRR-repeat protein At4g14096-like [Camelina sativa]|uniref:F-box/LRR-repeat protein At4g14096-like n=1 Tax=Camelina sativa TaxID=90675 RepID=A0ABM0SKD8_CAMSA|nr:PREDICTED: F-box/LRR-repeat protein At4g14096-like [Camelina sativa]